MFSGRREQSTAAVASIAALNRFPPVTGESGDLPPVYSVPEPRKDEQGAAACLESWCGLRWRARRLVDFCFGSALLLLAAASVLTTLGIIWVLCSESWIFFRQVTIAEFLTGVRWTPLFQPQSFGVLPLLAGTAVVTVISAVVALPVGLSSAIYLSEYASHSTRAVLKPLVEVLAGIPTVVYGYFALCAVTPLLRQVLPQTQVFNAASAAVVVAVMILPVVISLCDDALRAVPDDLRRAGRALGATRLEVIRDLLIPSALSGIVAAFILALSRAIGETMAVALAAGGTPRLTLNPLESIQTMTGYIVQVSLGDTPAGSLEYQTIFAVGALLFTITLFLSMVSRIVVRHAWRSSQ